jgi:hypothetical protein
MKQRRKKAAEGAAAAADRPAVVGLYNSNPLDP